MSLESPHPRAAKPTAADLQRNERMIDAVQGLSRQLAQTEQTLQTFISALSGGAAPEAPAAPAAKPSRPARPAASPQRAADGDASARERPPAGLAGHVRPAAHEQPDRRG